MKEEYGINLIKSPEEKAPYDAVIVAVKHDELVELNPEFFSSISSGKPILVDVKGIYDRKRFGDFVLWRL